MRVLLYPELKPEKGIPYTMVHLGRLEAAGQFPRRIHLTPGAVAWAEDELDAWLEERAAARDMEPPKASDGDMRKAVPTEPQ